MHSVGRFIGALEGGNERVSIGLIVCTHQGLTLWTERHPVVRGTEPHYFNALRNAMRQDVRLTTPMSGASLSLRYG